MGSFLEGFIGDKGFTVILDKKWWKFPEAPLQIFPMMVLSIKSGLILSLFSQSG